MSGLKTGLSITGLLVFGTTTSLFAKIGEACPGLQSPPGIRAIALQWPGCASLIALMHMLTVVKHAKRFAGL